MKKSVALVASIVAVGAVLIAVGYANRSKRHRDDAAGRQAIFQQVWHTIGANFYDRDMNGLNWLAVRTTYERKVRSAKNSFELYWNVLIPMAAVLESSHVKVTPPTSKRPDSNVLHASLNARESDLETCVGLLFHLGRRPVSSRVLKIDSNSPLYLLNVRPGWRFYGMTAAASDEHRVALSFLSTSGESEEVVVLAEGGRSHIDLALVRRELSALGRAKMLASNSDAEVSLGSLGMTVSLGQNGTMAGVVDVKFESLAERSGIEPGSEFQEFHVNQEESGWQRFLGKLISPDGRRYSASFIFNARRGS